MARRVFSYLAGPSIGCRKNSIELQVRKTFGLSAGLREDELELMSGIDRQRCSRLRAHANPINARRRKNGAVCLDCDFGAPRVKHMKKRLVELQKGLPPGADNEGTCFRITGCRPL